MKRFLFNVREFVWVIVSEIEDWVYPYRNRLTPEEKYEHEMLNPITGEIEIVENLIQSQNQRIERLQDEMINVMNRLYNIEQNLKSINTYSENKFNQVNPNERQESGKNSNQTSKTTP
tara:strand:- start:792 stop:1145 length:354 start_codon:yes stop_codon:yes gene_type:complete